MLSDSHRNNILSDLYEDTGVAVVHEKNQIIIVQLFGLEIPPNIVNSIDKDTNNYATTDILTNKSFFLSPNASLAIASFFISLASLSVTITALYLVFRHFPFSIQTRKSNKI